MCQKYIFYYLILTADAGDIYNRKSEMTQMSKSNLISL